MNSGKSLKGSEKPQDEHKPDTYVILLRQDFFIAVLALILI